MRQRRKVAGVVWVRMTDSAELDTHSAVQIGI
jgi:hypothetical protein